MIVGAVSSPHIESNFVGIPIGPLAVFVRHWLALGVQNPATCANANLPARSLVPEQNIVIVGFLSLLTLKLLGLRQIHDRIRFRLDNLNGVRCPFRTNGIGCHITPYFRSEARREGNECFSTCSCRGSPLNKKNKTLNISYSYLFL